MQKQMEKTSFPTILECPGSSKNPPNPRSPSHTPQGLEKFNPEQHDKTYQVGVFGSGGTSGDLNSI
jgi:hypothetical protein